MATPTLTIIPGASFRQVWRWKTGTPAFAVNLTSYSAQVLFLASEFDKTPLFAITPTLGGSAGTIQADLTPVQTETLENLTEVIVEVYVTDGSAFTTRLYKGTASVCP
jgi:hypothetical protein